ncbi:MAG: pyridoxamine 5'-phosphate oxidase [Gaiellaceae bacterium]
MSDPRAQPLDETDLDREPMRQFEAWFREAAGLPLPEATALATATRDGRPSARMVLLKGADERGFTFFTGYESRKASELAENPHAALLFYWYALGRQVRVEGTVEPVEPEESEAYFRTRPRLAQLAAWASAQSRPLAGREELETRFAQLESEFEGREIPLPPHWGGYRLAPEAFEFWQHRENRLHDRFRYTRAREGWTIERLGP